MTSVDGGKWDLTPEAFERLLAHLAPDREVAAREYERVRRMLLNFFGWRGSPCPGAEADETLDRVARRLAEGESIEHVQRYIYGVARRVFSEVAKRRERERAQLSQWSPDRGADVSRVKEDRSACLDECLPHLPADERTLLREYYEGPGGIYLEGRRELAQRLGITYGALRVRAHRARVVLERCVVGCLRRKGGDAA
jgi:DNA-directed RNA polymerase specialized sigma24 family protein